MIILAGHIHLTPSELMHYGVLEETIKVGLQRNRSGASSWVHVRDVSDKRRVLIKLDTIPASTRKLIPDEETLRSSVSVVTANPVKAAQMRFRRIEDHAWGIGQGLSGERASGIMESAAWMRLLHECTGKRSVTELTGGALTSKAELEAEVVAILGPIKPWGLHQVDSVRTLQDRLKRWRKGLEVSQEAALKTLIHGQVGNNNREKINDQVQNLLLKLWINEGSDAKMTPDRVYKRYVILASDQVDRATGEVLTLPTLAYSTVEKLLRRPDIRPLARYVHGNKWYRDMLRPYVLGEAPQYAWSFLSSDGQVMPFWLRIGGKDTWKRATCYLIFDVASQAIVGWAVGLQETHELMYQAFKRMMLTHAGVQPAQIQLDNFGRGYKTELERLIPLVSFCEPLNPQSKYAEPLINQFENKHLAGVTGFVGKNITTKDISSRRNPDHARVCYELHEVIEIYEQAIESWNASASAARGGKIRQDLLERVHPEAGRVQWESLVSLFGEATITEINRGYVRITHRGEDYVYEVPDYVQMLPQLKNGYHVRVRYIPGQMDRVLLANFNPASRSDLTQDTMLTVARQADRTQRAQAEQTERDAAILGHHLKRAAAMDAYTEDMLRKVQSLEIESLSTEEAGAVIGAGYTGKGTRPSEQKPKPAAQSEQPEKQEEFVTKPRINPRFL